MQNLVGLLAGFFLLCGVGNAWSYTMEYDLSMTTSVGNTYDLSFLVNTDEDGYQKDQFGNIISQLDNEFYFYATLTRDGAQEYTVENWYDPIDSKNTTVFDNLYGNYTSSLRRVFINVVQNDGADRVGYSLMLNYVTDFNDTWHEQVSYISMYDFANPGYAWQYSSSDNFSLAVRQSTVPEPATMALFSLGLAGVMSFRGRK